MIYQLFVFALIVVFGAILNYPLRFAVNEVMEYAESNYPAFVSGPVVAFMKAVDYWRLLLLVLLPALLWFFVQVQKPRREGY